MMFHDDSRLPTIVYHLGIGMIKPHSFDVELGKAFRPPHKEHTFVKSYFIAIRHKCQQAFHLVGVFFKHLYQTLFATELGITELLLTLCDSHIYKQLEVGEHRNKKRKHRNLYRGKCHVNSLMREEKTAAVA